MDSRRFDEFAKVFAVGATRRRLLVSLALGAVGAVIRPFRRADARQDATPTPCDGDQDCPFLNVCCSGFCCPPQDTCLDGFCCPQVRVCEATCCPEGESCAVGSCCPERQACPDVCCGDGQLCADDRCCPREQTCLDEIDQPISCCDPEIGACTFGGVCCRHGNECGSGALCCKEEEECINDECRARDGSAISQTIPNLPGTFAMPNGYALINGTRCDQSSCLDQLNVPEGLREQVGDLVITSYRVLSGLPSADSSDFAAGATVSVFALKDIQATLTFLEGTFFSLPQPFDDLTNTISCAEPVDKKFVIGRQVAAAAAGLRAMPTLQGATGRRLHTGFHVGAYVGEVILDRIDGDPDPNELCALADELVANIRRLIAGESPEPPGLGPLLIRVEGVPGASVYPARLNGKDVPFANESRQAARNRRTAHGEAAEVWLSSFDLPGEPFRVFNRVWEFPTAELAAAFVASLLDPLRPSYEAVGIETDEVVRNLGLPGARTFDFTWPQEGGIWIGHQGLVAVDRIVLSASFTNVTGVPAADLPAQEEAKPTTRQGLEELLRDYYDLVKRLLGENQPPAVLPPAIPVPPVLKGGGKPKSGLFDNEEGEYKRSRLTIVGSAITKGEKPKVLDCATEFVIYAVDIRQVGGCAGLGGPNDRDNDVCKDVLAEATKQAGTIPCPKDDCPERELTEIYRGWDCKPLGPDAPGKFTAGCAVELKLVCRPQL